MSNDRQANQKIKDELSRLVASNPCKKCRDTGLPKCYCKLPAGKSETGGSDNDKPMKAELVFANTENNAKKRQIENELSSEEIQLSEFLLRHPQFANLFLVEHNKLTGALTLKANPNLSKDEQALIKQFLRSIQKDFELFKQILKDKGINVNYFTAVLSNDGSLLTITIPTLKYYDEFVDRLSNQLGLQLRDQQHSNDGKPFHPTPLSTQLKPNKL